ncbi:MAG TPA: ABC transporter ATP-binding protein [Candidatus Saccharimonadales bacterium]|nr:ABC transporter ATP-binding protein [Candidatus Saccharimonadales bacterium]
MDVVLRAKGLTKRYGSLAALDSLDLELKKGEVLGYLGPNGAGKTTTIRLLLGLIAPTAGNAEIFGLDTQQHKVEIHKHVAYVPGEATLWPALTGMETLHLLGKVHGAVDVAYRDKLIKRFQFEPHKKVRTYSKGNRQKINLIAAFATRADLLILDEPTSGLDPLMEQAFRECVLEAKQNGQTVFLSSHILDEVEALCDRVAILRAGKLVEVGTLADMRHLSAVTIEATFDNEPPSLAHLKGVRALNVHGHSLTCQVQGSMSEVLSAIAAARPKTFLSREPSLEELFLSLYGDEEKRSVGAGNER